MGKSEAYSITIPAWAHATLERAMLVRGFRQQLARLKEECLELALAIVHLERGRDAEDDVVNELSDVLVMALQIRGHIGADVVDAHVAMKLDRLRGRMLRGEEW